MNNTNVPQALRCVLIFAAVFLLLALAVTPVSAAEEKTFEVGSFEELKEAVAWSNGNTTTPVTILVSQEIALTSSLTIQGTVTLQPTNHKKGYVYLYSPLNGNAFIVQGSLTICDTDVGEDNDRHLFIHGREGVSDSLVRVENGGTFNMEGGYILGNSATNGVGVYVAGGEFNMEGGYIRGNSATNGGGVYVAGGEFNMEGGYILGNSATNGGGVYMAGGEFNMEGGYILDNPATNGGGVYMAGGKFIMDGGGIIGNPATNGGGVYMTGGTYLMTGGDAELYDNTARGNGGGLYISGGIFELTGKKIQLNTARGNGGGIYINGGDVGIVGGEISQNSAKMGGAVYINDAGFEMRDGSLSQNRAQYGSAVHVTKNTDFIMMGGSIRQNTATDDGGVVYVEGDYSGKGEHGEFWMAGGSITDNKADSYGGVMVGGSIILHGSPIITGNTGPDLCLIDTPALIYRDNPIPDSDADTRGLTEGARIGVGHMGVNTENPTVVAEGEHGDNSNYITKQYEQYFFSDMDDYTVVYDARRLYLVYDPPEPQGTSTWMTSSGGSYSLYTGTQTDIGTVSFPSSSPISAVALPEGVSGDIVVSTEKDPSLPAVPTTGTVYRQFDISAPALPYGTSATLTLNVPKIAIPAGQGVLVLHYQGEDRGWVSEKTSARVLGDIVQVSATVSGFSPFAVVFEEGGAIPTEDEDVAPPLDFEGAGMSGTSAESPAPVVSVVAGLVAGFVVMRRR